MKLTASALLAGLCSTVLSLDLPVRPGIGATGYNPVSIALGGVRTLSFEDPTILLSNPSGISARLSGTHYSLAYGPMFMSADYNDAAGNHRDSWIIPMGCYSAGMRVPVMDELTLGVAMAATSVIPFRTIHQIPPHLTGNLQPDSPGETEIEGDGGEAGIGAAWDAADWLIIGAGGFWRYNSQEFSFSSGPIDFLEYGSNEYSTKAGITIPLERATFAVSWSQGGEYTDTRFAMGGKMEITEGLEAGAEFQSDALNQRDLQTARVFASYRTSPSLVLRGGLFFSPYTEEVSREGMGFSCGGGFTTGWFMINLGFGVFPVRGQLDGYGYTEMTSYDGTAAVVSAGLLIAPD